jgi:hypothetical protein
VVPVEASAVKTDDDPGVGEKRVVFLEEFDILKTRLRHDVDQLKQSMVTPCT